MQIHVLIYNIQQFLTFLMIDFQKLIMERITIVQTLATNLQSIVDKQILKSIQSQAQTNRNVLKCISLIKNKQRQRIKTEGLLLDDLKGLRFFNKTIIEEVYNVSRSVFYLYNQDLQQLESNHHTISENLRQLYRTFFQKQQTRISAKQITQILQNQIDQVTPFVLLGWTCQWSRNLLSEKIQQVLRQQYIRHEQQTKAINGIYIKQLSDAANKKQLSSNIATQVSVSSCVIKNNDKSICLTNKQSVFGLFLDQLSQYYKTFPVQLELDFTFVKSMRKVFFKGNLFQNQQNLQKAIQILIQSKNKQIKESQELYKTQCMNYLIKNPNSLSQNWLQKSINRNSSENCVRKRKWKKIASKINSLERIKSQSKQENYRPLHQNSRDSFLLHPRPNDISFDLSKQKIKIFRQKDKKQIELPQIIKKNNSNLYNLNKAAKNYSVHKSLAINNEKYMPRSNHISPKNLQLKQSLVSPVCFINQIQKIFKNNSYLQNNKKQELGLLVRRESEQFRQNRKLMLQLLRQKNKNYIFEK